jgi:hypothetical protein
MYGLAFVFILDLIISKRVKISFSSKDIICLIPFFVILFQTYELAYATTERYNHGDGDYYYFTAIVESIKINHSVNSAVYHTGLPINYLFAPFLAPAQLADFSGISSQFALWGVFAKIVPVICLGTISYTIVKLYEKIFNVTLNKDSFIANQLMAGLMLLFLAPLHFINLLKFDFNANIKWIIENEYFYVEGQKALLNTLSSEVKTLEDTKANLNEDIEQQKIDGAFWRGDVEDLEEKKRDLEKKKRDLEKKYAVAENLAALKEESKNHVKWYSGFLLAAMFVFCGIIYFSYRYGIDILEDLKKLEPKAFPEYFGFFLLKFPFAILMGLGISGFVIFINKILILIEKINNQQRNISQINIIAKQIDEATINLIKNTTSKAYLEEAEKEKGEKNLFYKLITNHLISLNKNVIDEKENKKINITDLKQIVDLAKNLIDKK